MSKHRFYLIIVPLILALMAACTPVPPVQPTAPAVPTTAIPTMAATIVEPTQSLPTATTPPEPTATLEPTATAEAVLTGKEVSANGISFFLPENVAEDSTGTVYKAKPITADAPYWDKMPDHYYFTFTGYQHSNSMHLPRVYIWPIADYIDENPGFEPTVTLLQNLLAQSATTDLVTADLPFPPLFNAAKIVSLKPDFLNFQNGSGVRYLTFFAQAATPITNYGLFYTFQGITTDGLYYINAILPVGQSELPVDDTGFQIDAAFYDQYETYLAQLQMQVNEAPAGSFTPDLASLDAMISSMLVNPSITADSVYSQYADFYRASILLNSILGLDYEEDNQEATAGDGSDMPMSIHPYLGGLKLTGYPLQEQFHKPRIFAFDVEEYMAMDPRVTSIVDALKAILAAEDQPIPTDDRLPFFPMFPAAQVFHTQAKILHVQNGSGLRYLTMYSQALLPVDNYSLFYTFQGLSKDQKTYVIAILPIKASILPETGAQPADIQAFIDNYATYIGEVTADLNALPDEEFTPNLDEIDRLIETIRVY